MAKGNGSLSGSWRRGSLEEAVATVSRVASIIKINGGHASRESQVPPIEAGKLPPSIKKFAEKNGIHLESDKLYITTKGIEHSLRESKTAKGIAVTKEELVDFVRNRDKMAQYYDPRKGDFIFATDKAKFVVTPNYEIKINKQKTKVANYITATRINPQNIDEFQKMIKIRDAKQR